MTRCAWTEMCPFFNDAVGYSIDLQAQMRITHCLGDNSQCARLRSIDVLPLSRIPDDLIPTEHDRLDAIVGEYETEICRRRHAEEPDCC